MRVMSEPVSDGPKRPTPRNLMLLRVDLEALRRGDVADGELVEGCSRTRLQIDHREPWARTRHTRLGELDPPCKHLHDLKTYQGWALVEGTGKRPMVPPDDPRHPNYKPPP